MKLLKVLKAEEREERFSKIRSFVLANQKRGVIIKEISIYTGFYPKQINKLIQEFDEKEELRGLIVDGRKHKFESSTVLPEEIQVHDKKMSVLNLMDLAKENRRVEKFIFDASIMNLKDKHFLEILKNFQENGIVPEFYIYSNDLLKLDKNKAGILQRELIKFFAQDEGRFHKIVPKERPEGETLAKLCKNKDYCLISGDAKNVAWCKLYGAKVYIPPYFLRKYPSPFHGKKTIGLDSCMMAVKKEEIDLILKDFETVLISDIQLNEMVGGYVLSIIAYYGKIGFSIETGTDNDQNICEFYKENPVHCVYTQDYAFSLFAEMAGINCVLYKSETATSSKILNVMLSNNINTDIKEEFQITLDGIEWKDGKLILPNKLKAYSVSGIQRTGFAYSQDFLVFKKRNIVGIVQIQNKDVAIIKYFGTSENIPSKYKFAME